MEAAKKDAGPTSTKALTDTRKMAKAMKDMHDLIRARATENIRSSLRTFGVRVSGPSISFYSLHQHKGRFYQLGVEFTAGFPAHWDELSTTSILSVLVKLLAYKKELSETARQVNRATQDPFMTTNKAYEDEWAATLTTPTNSPRLTPLM
jgi:hypothetical protein